MGRVHRKAIQITPARPAGQGPAALLACGLALGLAAQARAADPAGPGTLPPLTEAPAAVRLPMMEVTGSAGSGRSALPEAYAGGQVARGSSLGLLGTRSVMDSPFSTTSFTSRLIEDQQARTAADTLVNDASVRLTTGANGFDDTFQIRGYPVQAQDVGLNGLYGLISSNRVQAQLIERIDLLRGPGALINGIAPGGSIGGAVNIISKRAGEEPLTRLTTTYIGSANFGVAADLSRRYGPNKEWGIRFNGLVRDGEASIDRGNLRSGLGALGLDYRGERLRWSFDGIFQRDDTRNFRPQINILPTATAIPSPPDARSNWFPGTRLSQQDTTVATRFEYDLTDSLTAYAAVGYRDGWNQQVFPSASPGVDAAGGFQVSNAFYDSYSRTVSGTAGANWRFNLLGVNHTLNLAYTGFQQEGGNAYISDAASLASSIYDPVRLPAVAAARTDPRRASDTTLSSFALADTMSVANDRVLLTVGVRRQEVRLTGYDTATGAQDGRYDVSATTPLAGLVVKPLENVSLYANYAEGLTQGSIVGPSYANVGAILAPFRSQQVEAGVRVDWGVVTTTASVFQITQPNAIRTAANELANDGEQRNRGLELSAYGEVMPGLRGILSATFLKPELTSPEQASQRGNLAAGVPERTVSAGLDWEVPGVPGLGTNGRVIYTSGSYLSSDNTLRFDGWTRVDIGMRYRTEIDRKPVVFRANLENALDENYWLTAGTYQTVGSPRTVILSASMDF